jgi:Uma2 family endonuclease
MMNSTVCGDPVIAPTRHRLTVEEYHRMGEAGIFDEDDRIELIDGELIDMAPIGTRYAYIVNLLTRFFVKQASDEKLVCIQNPVQLGDHGEPEPDVAIVVNRNYAKQHPQSQDILLLIEVADASVEYERDKKIPFYAHYRVPEVWVVDLRRQRVEVHREPLTAEKRYRDVVRFAKGKLAAINIPEVEIVIENMWC